MRVGSVELAEATRAWIATHGRPDVVVGGGSAFHTTVSAGFDSFGERFSIAEDDTLDFTNEFRSQVGLDYRYLWGP